MPGREGAESRDIGPSAHRELEREAFSTGHVASLAPALGVPYLAPVPDGQASFAERLIETTRELGNPLCVGLDPYLDRIPQLFRRGDMQPAKTETADAVADFCSAVLERLPDRVAAVKPQSAFFERLGWPGMRALEGIVRSARSLGLLVILDAKRGDIGSTSEAYADTYLSPGSPLESDAVTLQPYLGLDALEPFVARAETFGRGVFILVRTSNAGARDFQDQAVGGQRLFLRVAERLAETERRLAGDSDWSSLGVVAGATYPEDARALRELLPRSLFLVPGYGAQGGSAADAVHGFVPGPGGRLEGGIVNASRSVLYPDGSADAELSEWERRIDAAVSKAVSELEEAVRPG